MNSATIVGKILPQKTFTVPSDKIIEHNLPPLEISPALRSIDRVVLALTQGNHGFHHVYLGLIPRNTDTIIQKNFLGYRPTDKIEELGQIHRDLSELLESGNYELHLYPPDIAALSQVY